MKHEVEVNAPDISVAICVDEDTNVFAVIASFAVTLVENEALAASFDVILVENEALAAGKGS